MEAAEAANPSCLFCERWHDGLANRLGKVPSGKLTIACEGSLQQ